jgi:hypothetical protein
MRNDIKNHVSLVRTIAPGVHSTTQTGDAVDLANFDAAAVIIDVAAVTNDDFDIEVQESDTTTSGDFTDVADADLDGTELVDVVADTITVIGYHGTKRYIRALATDKGAGDATFGVAVLRAKGRVKP